MRRDVSVEKYQRPAMASNLPASAMKHQRLTRRIEDIELLITNRGLARKFDELETRLDKKLTEHDKAIAAILAAIRELMRPPEPQRRGIGFTADLFRKS